MSTIRLSNVVAPETRRSEPHRCAFVSNGCRNYFWVLSKLPFILHATPIRCDALKREVANSRELWRRSPRKKPRFF